ncbi:hypothetical protein [Thalassobius vesicularis]|nr:hypothetical protein [Thalassobius vesicularis]
MMMIMGGDFPWIIELSQGVSHKPGQNGSVWGKLFAPAEKPKKDRAISMS